MFQSGENPPILKSGFKTPESKLKPQKRFLRHILVEPNVISFSNCSCANLGTMSVMWIVHLSIRLLGMDVCMILLCNAMQGQEMQFDSAFTLRCRPGLNPKRGGRNGSYIYSTSLGSTWNDF